MKKGFYAVIGFVVLLAGIVGYNAFINRNFKITEYTVKSNKISNDFKGVLIADLHEKNYGEKNKKLLDAIEEIKPDVIFIAGDLVNDTSKNFDESMELLKSLGKTAPVYYGFGNHEYKLKLDGNFSCLDEMKNLENVHVIEYGVDKVEINGNKFKIGSLSVPSAQWEKYGKEYFELFEDPDSFYVLMSHYPWLIPEKYPETSVDVVLAGHAHGGHVHLWDDLGLYVPGQGFFQRYTSGKHDINRTTEIVSRGLGDHTILPRINNQPELVVVRFEAEK